MSPGAETEHGELALAVGAEEVNARVELGDGDCDDGRYGIIQMHEDCDHVHVGSFNRSVFFQLAPRQDGEIGAKFNPEQARALAYALLHAAKYATEDTDADVVLENDLAGDADE